MLDLGRTSEKSQTKNLSADKSAIEKLADKLLPCYAQTLTNIKGGLKMRTCVIALIVVFAIGLLSVPALTRQPQIERDAGLGLLSSNSQKGGEDETGPYEGVAKWPQPFARQGYIQRSQGGVFAES